MEFDPGRKYSVPWLWGTTGVVVNTKYYDGDINTSAIFLDPPDGLKGKINVPPQMDHVMALAVMYHGGEPCTDDKDILRKVRDGMVAAKEHWAGLEYGSIETFGQEDYLGGLSWNGATFRMRLQNSAIKYGYPKEGFVLFMDSVVVLKDSKNVENAKLFHNFIMDPKNAALLSEFARYANAIKGSEEFMPADMKDAPEIVMPAEFVDKGRFTPACAPKTTALYTRIWTELQK